MTVVDRQQRSKVVLITLYFFCVISERSRGKVSVGMMGSMQLLARQMPKQIRTNPVMKYRLCIGRVSGSAWIHALWMSIILPNPSPTMKEKK